MKKDNIYSRTIIPYGSQEIFETILLNENIKVERIISAGQKTPEELWIEEDKDEWVILLQGEARIKFTDGNETELKKGDYITIHSGVKHKVTYTSRHPVCIWLAIYFKNVK